MKEHVFGSVLNPKRLYALKKWGNVVVVVEAKNKHDALLSLINSEDLPPKAQGFYNVSKSRFVLLKGWTIERVTL